MKTVALTINLKSSVGCFRNFQPHETKQLFCQMRVILKMSRAMMLIAHRSLSFATLQFVAITVLRLLDIDGFRVAQMNQDKAWSTANGQPFSKTATPYWIIWAAPFGRPGKHLPAVLRLLKRASHSRQGVPSDQPLPVSLNPSISSSRSTSYYASLRLAKNKQQCTLSIIQLRILGLSIPPLKLEAHDIGVLNML